MRRCICSAFSVALLSLPIISPDTILAAPQAEPDSVQTDEGDSGADARVRISIDERGIRVEGDTRGGEDTDWVEISDERYREKGTDIVRFGESVFVARDEVVRGDLVVFAGTAIIEGKVTGDVVILGGDLRVRTGADIKGNAMVLGGTLDADVGTVRGEMDEIDNFWPTEWYPQLDFPTGWLAALCLAILIFIHLVLFFLVLLFLRERMSVTHDHLAASYLKCFGAGLLSTLVLTFVLPLVFILLIISVLGIPVVFLLSVSVSGIFIISQTVFVYAFGRLAVERMGVDTDNPFMHVLIGMLFLNIPAVLAVALSFAHTPLLAPVGLFLDMLALFVYVYASVSGLGALVLSRFGSRVLIVPGAVPPPPHPTEPATT